MTSLCTVMLMIIATLTLIMPPRIFHDWLRFAAYRQDGELDRLIALQGAENQWMFRHLACAFTAIVMVAFLKLHPALDGAEQLSAVTAAYAVMTLLFAVAESLLAQKIARFMMTAARDDITRVPGDW